MSAATPFDPLAKISAEENLAAYIKYSRNEVTAMGKDLDFDADVWDITEYCVARGERRAHQSRRLLYFRKRIKDGGAPLSKGVGGFAKAYVRSEVAQHASAAMNRAVDAFRAIDEAMELQGVQSICDCDATTFNCAVSILVSKVGPATVDAIGPRLGQIARFMDERGLCRFPLGSWKYAKQRASTHGRIGKEYEERKLAKMPSQDALDALARAFCLASDPRDLLVTGVAAILCSAPERLNEVMVLASDCEVEQIGNDGKRYLGLRWAGSKGYSDHIKLILPGMADIVREALQRIRDVTVVGRNLAKWYEHNPTKLFLPPNLAHIRENEFIEYEEIGELLGMKVTVKNRGNLARWVKVARLPVTKKARGRHNFLAEAVRFDDFERFVVGLLPRGFPILDAKTGLKYSDALLVMPEGLFQRHSGGQCMFEPLKHHHIECALGGNAGAKSVTVFQRTGVDPDRRFIIKSHQFRHWLNTLAQGANLSQVDIAKWSGRASVQQNSAYDHVSSNEIVLKIRQSVGDHAKAIGPLAEIPKNLPVTRAEFAAMAVPTAHVTLYGFCIHDFTTTPCEMFRKCLDCRDHVCIKGLPSKTERVQQALEEAQKMLAKARQAVAEEVYGAEDWVVAHQAAVDRMVQLLAILTDPKVADGAVIQLSATNTYSLSEGAMQDRKRLEGSGTPELQCAATRKALA